MEKERQIYGRAVIIKGDKVLAVLKEDYSIREKVDSQKVKDPHLITKRYDFPGGKITDEKKLKEQTKAHAENNLGCGIKLENNLDKVFEYETDTYVKIIHCFMAKLKDKPQLNKARDSRDGKIGSIDYIKMKKWDKETDRCSMTMAMFCENYPMKK